MAMALSSGMDTDEAMDVARRLNSDTAMAGKIETCRELMQGGKGLSEAISAADILPPIYCRMLTIGMKAGSADTVMAEIASRGEEEVNDRIFPLSAKGEPTLVIIMSVIVGLIPFNGYAPACQHYVNHWVR